MADDSLFVTGTDTGVGKSVVCAALAAARVAEGRPVRALKPIASGVPEGEAGEDATLLGFGGGHPPLSLVRLHHPLSPHRAAAMQGVEVEPSELLAWVRERASVPVLVEGAGGWEVPITPSYRMSDLAVDLGYPVLVVAADRLGAINHTLLTVAAVRARGLPVAGVVLTPIHHDVAARYNRDDLAALLPDVPMIPMPRVDPAHLGSLAAAGRAVAAALGPRPV